MTTPEELRNKEIEACDGVLGAPWIVQKMIGAEGRRLARTNRTFWQQATPDELARLLAIYEKEPVRASAQGEEGDAMSAIIAPFSQWRFKLTGEAHIVQSVAEHFFGDAAGVPVVVFCSFTEGKVRYLPVEQWLKEFEPNKGDVR